jgi:hypothetical protein
MEIKPNNLLAQIIQSLAYELDNQGIMVQFPAGAGDFSLSQNFNIRSLGSASPLFSGYQELFSPR